MDSIPVGYNYVCTLTCNFHITVYACSVLPCYFSYDKVGFCPIVKITVSYYKSRYLSLNYNVFIIV